MNTSTLTYQRRETFWLRCADYLELTKPKIALLELVTVAVAAFAAGWVGSQPWVLVHALLGTALVAASASALNQWLEVQTDARMDRTATRPLPMGRLSSTQVVIFALLTLTGGLVYLALATSGLTAALGAATWFTYVCIYTPLKSRTDLNTPVGAVAGALPVLMGWSAATGQLDSKAWVLFAIVFLWQFPHFMSIAWLYRDQYKKAGLKMAPVVDPSGRKARRLAVITALLLLPVSLLPALIEPVFGPLFFVAAGCMGLVQLGSAIQFARRLDNASARRLMRVSVIYLPLILLWVLFGPWI